MNYREIRASGAAAAFIECYWLLELTGGETGRIQRVVPDGRAELILNFAQPFQNFHNGRWQTQPTCLLAGQITRPLLLRSNGPAKVLGIRFRPQGVSRICGLPLQEVSDSVISIGDLEPGLGSDLEPAWERASFEAQVSVATAALERTAIKGRSDLLIDAAVARITQAHGTSDIAQLAASLGISTRQLERRFLEAVGMPPKLFSRILRFQHVFQAIEQGRTSWVEAAQSCGYYDQAHLIRDFKEFSGEAPSVLLAGTDLARQFLR